MDTRQAAQQAIDLQRLMNRWDAEGMSEQAKWNRLNAYLDEKKRKRRD